MGTADSPRPGPRSANRPAPSPRSHMRQTRGCGCNAGRALPRAGREHAGRVAHSRWLGTQGGEEEIEPSSAGARAAAAPALLVFWNLPHAGARGRMGRGEEKRGRERRPRARHPRRHEEGARPPLFPPPAGRESLAWTPRLAGPTNQVRSRTPPLAPRPAPGPVTSPGWPSPTDSEVKRNVPSSMNASWKPLSCPFMVVVVVSECGVEK